MAVEDFKLNSVNGDLKVTKSEDTEIVIFYTLKNKNKI